MPSLDELLAAERAGWDALCTDGGAAFYRENLAPGAVMVFGPGVMTRDEAIEAIAAAPPWARYAIQDPQVVELTATSAALVYRAEAQRPAEPPYSAMVSSTFVREAGRWLLALHQQTPV
jgi:hypothetical protein